MAHRAAYRVAELVAHRTTSGLTPHIMWHITQHIGQRVAQRAVYRVAHWIAHRLALIGLSNQKHFDQIAKSFRVKEATCFASHGVSQGNKCSVELLLRFPPHPGFLVPVSLSFRCDSFSMCCFKEFLSHELLVSHNADTISTSKIQRGNLCLCAPGSAPLFEPHKRSLGGKIIRVQGNASQKRAPCST